MELYESSVVQEPQTTIKQKQKTSVNDIARMGGMTRSGRCYAPVNSKSKEGKNFTENEGIKIAIPRGKDKEVINESDTKAEVNEFL